MAQQNIRSLWIKIGLPVLLLSIGFISYFMTRTRGTGDFITPTRGAIVEAIYGLGKVKARREFDLKIGILDNVQQLFVREGDIVSKSAPLIKFAESAIFRAPFSGVVTLVAAEVGESVSPQTPVIRVSDLDDRFVEVSLEQQGALRVRNGQTAEVVLESLRGEKLKGTVSALFSKNDEFLAHIEVAGLRPNVLPGMTADIAIIVDRKENALLVPVRAVNNGQVVIRREGKRMKVQVEVGGVDGQMAEITSGELKESDEVLVGSVK